MKQHWRYLATVAVVALVAAACGGGGGTTGTETPSGGTPSGGIPAGGTLMLATPSDIQSGWDPAKEYEIIAWEVFRCCLTRTLYSYTGMGGPEDTAPMPDRPRRCPRSQWTA